MALSMVPIDNVRTIKRQDDQAIGNPMIPQTFPLRPPLERTVVLLLER